VPPKEKVPDIPEFFVYKRDVGKEMPEGERARIEKLQRGRECRRMRTG